MSKPNEPKEEFSTQESLATEGTISLREFPSSLRNFFRTSASRSTLPSARSNLYAQTARLASFPHASIKSNETQASTRSKDATRLWSKHQDTEAGKAFNEMGLPPLGKYQKEDIIEADVVGLPLPQQTVYYRDPASNKHLSWKKCVAFVLCLGVIAALLVIFVVPVVQGVGDEDGVKTNAPTGEENVPIVAPTNFVPGVTNYPTRSPTASPVTLREELCATYDDETTTFCETSQKYVICKDGNILLSNEGEEFRKCGTGKRCACEPFELYQIVDGETPCIINTSTGGCPLR